MIETKVAPSVTDLSEFVASSEGLALIKAFMGVQHPRLKRRIVDLVEEIADYQIRGGPILFFSYYFPQEKCA